MLSLPIPLRVLLLRADRDQGVRVRRALMTLPDRAAEQLDPDWFAEGDTIRVADAFVIDLMFNACGESIDTLRDHIVTIEFDEVPMRTLDLAGMLKTKQTARDKDRAAEQYWNKRWRRSAPAARAIDDRRRWQDAVVSNVLGVDR